MVRPVASLLLVLLLFAPAAAAPPDVSPAEARERVAYHLKEVDELSRHFESVLVSACPRFASTHEWKHYFDGEVDRLVLLMAHLEQAWIEAKRTDNDDVRRTAKAPRHRVEQGRALIDKLQGCADDNGTSFAPFSIWRRIERDVPKRQAEIALPR